VKEIKCTCALSNTRQTHMPTWHCNVFQHWENFRFTKANRQKCRSLFQQVEIRSVPCSYTLSLRYFIIYYKVNFQTNSSLHNINTRNKPHLHRPNVNPSSFQKSTFYASIKIFNAILKNEEAKFEVTLMKSYKTRHFYTVGEFFMCKD